MTSRLATRPADEERFREFRARRLAKKESDREKLASEFPLLFNNKAVGNKVMNTTLTLNKSATIVAGTTPASKRKSNFHDKNDENCSSAANKIPKKSILGSKTPVSSKKPRHGSLLSPKPVRAVENNLSKTLPSIPTYKSVSDETTTVPSLNIEGKAEAPVATTPQKVVTDNDNGQTAATPFIASDNRSGVEMLDVSRKALFVDAELERCTSGRSSISSLGESIAPIEEKISASGSSDFTKIAVEDSAAVQEQVQDVLDYLLELDEVDAQTYRRVSSTRFSVKALRRLSMTMHSSTLQADVVPTDNSNSDPAAEIPVVAADEEVNADSMDTSDENLIVQQSTRTSAGVSMDVAYPASENEDCVIGEIDVLNALRSYLSTLNAQREEEVKESLSGSNQDTSSDAPVTAVEDAVNSEVTNSTRSSTSSAGTFEAKDEWSDALTCGSTRRGSLASIGTTTTTRTSCTTTMRVSFNNSQSANIATCIVSPVREKSLSEEAAATIPTPAAKQSGVVTHPLADLLDDALMRGLVVPTISRRMEMGNHTKYVIETQILSVPGYPEENSQVRMMGLKRYSDFKAFRAALLDVLEAKRRIERRSSLNGGSRSSIESGDILSVARSRRSSMERERESILLNASDSLCLESNDGMGFGTARPSELVPPLPSRQVMSMSCSSLQEEVDFQETREAFLRNWLESIFARQSCEGSEYRLELRKFLASV